MIVIYHNEGCGTSRNVLDIIRKSGTEPEIVNYLEAGWTRAQLLGLFAAAGITPRQALRTYRTEAEALGLTAPDVTDEALIDAMTQHPNLVNRPIVCSPLGVRLCRPEEAVLDLLDPLPPGPVTRKDGTVIIDETGTRLL